MQHLEKYSKIIVGVFVVCMFAKPALCFFILGCILLYAGIIAARFLVKVYRHGIECTGVILEFEKENDGHKNPVIEFTNLKGTVVRSKPGLYASTDSSFLKNYRNKIGQPVVILYDAEAPEKFVIVSEKTFSFFVFILFAFADATFIVVSVLGLLGYIKSMK